MNESAKKEKKASAFKKSGNMNVLLILVGFLAVIVVAQLVISASSGELKYPSMVSVVNLSNIMTQVACVGIMAMGMTFVMIAGGIDLSVGLLTSFVVLYIAKSFIDWGYPLPVSIIMGIFFAVLFETGMGFIISRLKVEPFIITLGGMICFRGVALLIVNSQEVSMQGAMDPMKNTVIQGLKDPVNGLSINIPPYLLIFIGVTFVVWFILKYTKYGRRIYAVGANPNAAYLAGINVKNIIMSTYTINGLLVGLGAVCLLGRVNTAIISTGEGLEIDVIASAVVGGVALSGGKGNAWGTFLGAILMGAITNGMSILKLQAEWQYVAKGLIIIAAVSAGAIASILQARKQLKQQNLEGRKDA